MEVDDEAVFTIEVISSRTIYYVSNAGNDANDGKTIDSPWKTLNKVHNAMKAGSIPNN